MSDVVHHSLPEHSRKYCFLIFFKEFLQNQRPLATYMHTIWYKCIFHMITVSQTPEIFFSFYTSFLGNKKFGKNCSAVQLSKSINPCQEIKGKSHNCIAVTIFKKCLFILQIKLSMGCNRRLITAFILWSWSKKSWNSFMRLKYN